MKIEKAVLSCILFFMVSVGFSQNKLTLEIGGVSSNNGNVCVALYQDEDSFLDFDKVFKVGSEKALKGEMHMAIDDIPDGEYAVAIFHDENGNKKLDTNFMGIPKEAYAFSKGKVKMFGPPKFDECAFEIKNDIEIGIVFE